MIALQFHSYQKRLLNGWFGRNQVLAYSLKPPKRGSLSSQVGALDALQGAAELGDVLADHGEGLR